MSKSNQRLGRGLETLLRNVAAAQTVAEPLPESTASTSTVGTATRDNYPSIVPFTTDLDAQDVESRRPESMKSEAAKLEEEKDRVLATYSNGRVATELDVDLIERNPFQPRLDFDESELQDLKASLAEHGLIQPIVVRQNGERYEIVAGERRFRAAKDSGWKKIPAIVFVVNDREMAELALTENIQRRDLNPIEKALAFRGYLDSYGGTHDELAKRLSLDRSTVSNLMRLLELHDEVQTMTRQGAITMGHARALHSLEEWDQLDMAKRIVEEGLSVRQTEAIVKEYLEGAGDLIQPRPTKQPAEVSPRIRDLEQQFRSWLGMKVKLTSNDKGKGKLVVQFNSNDEFERVYQMLKPREY